MRANVILPLTPMQPLPAVPTLKTARLVLRPYRDDDAPALVRELGVKAVADGTLRVPHPYPPERAAEFLAMLHERHAAGKAMHWAVTESEGGRLVGGAGLTITAAHHRAELGYWIAQDRWGVGLATEASRALVSYAFDTLGLHRVDAHHYVENPSSGAVMRKLGMQYEGRVRAMVWRDGVPRDLELYAILKTDPRPRDT
jgi:[ribosomal protein S5]-alanine N-acetyltransferase